MCACVDYFDQGRPGLSTIQLMHIQGPTIQTYEGPQGPWTMLLKSGTVPEFRGPLRPIEPHFLLLHYTVITQHGIVDGVMCVRSQHLDVIDRECVGVSHSERWNLLS